MLEERRDLPFVMASDKKKIRVKLLVDKEKSRVVHAEANKDFVDVLFSFLTLPLGTIVRVLHKQSSLGCMDNLYESVENLDVEHLQTEACKTMLLHPRSEAALVCEDVEINIDDTEPRDIYVCKEAECCSKKTCLYSSIRNTRCSHCEGTMGSVKTWPKSNVGGEKLFVKGGVKYIVSDELRVEPASVMHIISLIQNTGIKDVSDLEETYMDLGIDEILTLLKGLLVSKMPLTYLYFHHEDATDYAARNVVKKETVQVKTENYEETSTEGLSIKLLLNKANKDVLCIEAGDDFANQVLGFLTLPLGSTVMILNENLVTGCVVNLYGSVENLNSEYFQSENRRSVLLSTKLGPFFGSSKSVFKLDEAEPRERTTRGCNTCYWKKDNNECTSARCEHRVEKAVLKEMNPKTPLGGIEKGGGYAKGPGKFMVTDDLCVSPVCTSSTIPILNKLGSCLGDVVEREVRVGEAQVLNLLRAALNSKTPLTDVFSSYQNLRWTNLWVD